MDHSSWDRYGELSTDLTAEEIDEVLAMLEDTGPRRDPYLRSLARILTRLAWPPQDPTAPG
ncbi:hypothetical protein GCM10027589_34380 [Actinocorallia lasiicapitis]